MPDIDDADVWDEHASWIALLDDDNDVLPPADRSALVDRLGPAFVAHHHAGKDYIKHAFIPVVHHTKQLHDAILGHVFPGRTHALALLSDTNLRFENAARRDMTAALSALDDTKRSLDALFSTLDDLLRQSDLLFQTFKSTMLEHVQRLRRCSGQMPIDAERLIATLNSRAKHLGAEDHAKAKENLLRGILEKY